MNIIIKNILNIKQKIINCNIEKMNKTQYITEKNI